VSIIPSLKYLLLHITPSR